MHSMNSMFWLRNSWIICTDCITSLDLFMLRTKASTTFELHLLISKMCLFAYANQKVVVAAGWSFFFNLSKLGIMRARDEQYCNHSVNNLRKFWYNEPESLLVIAILNDRYCFPRIHRAYNNKKLKELISINTSNWYSLVKDLAMFSVKCRCRNWSIQSLVPCKSERWISLGETTRL